MATEFMRTVLSNAALAAALIFPVEPVLASDGASCSLCFFGPDNIVFDTGNNAYITDSDHQRRFRVLKVSPAGRVLGDWRIFQRVEGQKNGPEGIAIGADGNLRVTDGGALEILKVSPEGKVLSRIGGSEAGFRDLGHVAVDESGATYVSEAGVNRLQKFSAEGARVATWQPPKGEGEDEWYLPQSIAISGGNVVIEDWGNHRIVVQSSNGQRRLAFGDAKQLERTAGLCVDRDGNIYVADDKAHAVKKFDPRGKLLLVISNSAGNRLFTEGPSSIAVDTEDNLYAADGLSVVKFSPKGKLLQRWR